MCEYGQVPESIFQYVICQYRQLSHESVYSTPRAHLTAFHVTRGPRVRRKLVRSAMGHGEQVSEKNMYGALGVIINTGMMQNLYSTPRA